MNSLIIQEIKWKYYQMHRSGCWCHDIYAHFTNFSSNCTQIRVIFVLEKRNNDLGVKVHITMLCKFDKQHYKVGIKKCAPAGNYFRGKT